MRLPGNVFKASSQWNNRQGMQKKNRRRMDDENIFCSWIVSVTVWLLIGLTTIRLSSSDNNNSASSLRGVEHPPSKSDFQKIQIVASQLERLLSAILLQEEEEQSINPTFVKTISLRLETAIANADPDQSQYIWSVRNPIDRAIHWLALSDQYQQQQNKESLLSLSRYVIVILYFYTSLDHVNSWTKCAFPKTTFSTTRQLWASSTTTSTLSVSTPCGTSDPVLTPSSSVCHWYGITCSPQGTITRIDWSGNNLVSIMNHHHHHENEMYDDDDDKNSWPIEIVLLQDLELLWWFDNPQLQMTIPTFIHQFAPKLQSLSLQHVSLQGTIPTSFYQLTNLVALRLYDTQLSGTLSSQISNLRQLRWLWIHSTTLQGSIPVELNQLTNLQGLTIHGNKFIHAASDVVSCQALTQLETYWTDCSTSSTGVMSCECCTKCLPTRQNKNDKEEVEEEQE